jgi:phospholipid/cholesterol/gamma-HCH transport system substrate-binding protein
MKLTKSEKVRLGTFVATGLALFIGGVASLAGLKVWEKRDLYTVRFAESVSGLEVSAQVKYQGLRVGRVEGMRIDPKDPKKIEVTLAIDAGTPLYQGTQAVLDLSGITGLKTVNLTGGDPRGQIIAPGSELPAGESLVGMITGKAEAVAVKVEAIANNLAVWTGDENRVRMERFLESATKLLDDVDLFVVETRDPLAAALTEVAKSGDAIRGTANQGTKTMAELELTLVEARGAIAETKRILAQVDNETVKKTLASANKAMLSLDRRLSDEELGKSLVALQAALNQMTKLLQEMDIVVSAGREDFVASLEAIRQASEDLREFSRIIAQDPSVLLRGTEVGE